MADNSTGTSLSKIDAAAEKAFSAAAEKKTADAVSAKAIEKAVAADTTAPVKASTIADAVAADKPARQAPAKKVAAKKVAAKTKKAKLAKPVAKKTPVKIAARKPASAHTAASKLPTISQLKDKIMDTANTAKTTTNDYAATATGAAKDAAAQLQTRAKAAYEKGTEMTSDAAAFHKGNVEAMVESTKILVAGMQDMGRGYVETAKTAAETVQDDVKKMAAIKSPTEFFQLQGEIVRRNFDAAVAQTSKNAEAMMKLANEAFAPISNRASLATEKFSKAA